MFLLILYSWGRREYEKTLVSTKRPRIQDITFAADGLRLHDYCLVFVSSCLHVFILFILSFTREVLHQPDIYLDGTEDLAVAMTVVALDVVPDVIIVRRFI